MPNELFFDAFTPELLNALFLAHRKAELAGREEWLTGAGWVDTASGSARCSQRCSAPATCSPTPFPAGHEFGKAVGRARRRNPPLGHPLSCDF